MLKITKYSLGIRIYQEREIILKKMTSCADVVDIISRYSLNLFLARLNKCILSAKRHESASTSKHPLFFHRRTRTSSFHQKNGRFLFWRWVLSKENEDSSWYRYPTDGHFQPTLAILFPSFSIVQAMSVASPPSTTTISTTTTTNSNPHAHFAGRFPAGTTQPITLYKNGNHHVGFLTMKTWQSTVSVVSQWRTVKSTPPPSHHYRIYYFPFLWTLFGW